MVRLSALFYELTADEVTTLPHGFLLLELNTLYGNFRVFECGKNRVKRESEIVYLSIKDLPASFYGTKSTRPKYQKAPLATGEEASS